MSLSLSDQILRQAPAEVRHAVDARWLMAFAAGLDDENPAHFDTRAGLAAHPLFPVCLEWPAVLALREGPAAGLTGEVRARAVHAEHDLALYQPIRPGQTLTSIARGVALQQRSPGTLLTTRIDTRDAAGQLLCSTWNSTLFRGVTLRGPEQLLETLPAPPPSGATPAHYLPLPVPAGAAHRYTECARIYNPIHTDIAAAQAAGLERIILHGTATLGRAVSRLMASDLDAARRITRVYCRFAAPVHMPETLVLRVAENVDDGLAFSVWSSGGHEVLSRGYIGCAP